MRILALRILNRRERRIPVVLHVSVLSVASCSTSPKGRSHSSRDNAKGWRNRQGGGSWVGSLRSWRLCGSPISYQRILSTNSRYGCEPQTQCTQSRDAATNQERDHHGSHGSHGSTAFSQEW